MEKAVSYPKDSAGRLINSAVPVFEKDTIAEVAIQNVLSSSKQYKTIDYMYITNQHKVLIGVLSLKNLLDISKQNLSAPIYTFIKEQTLITVHPYSHQERAAQLAIKYNIKAIPVVDKESKFLGIIDSDHILSIMHKEKVEDLLKFAGISTEHNNFDDFLSISLWSSLKHRLPWLILGLAGGLAITQLIGYFEETLQETVIIAAFIPMMVYMSNAVGQQVTALLIRDVALSDTIPYAKYFIKQMLSVGVIGTIISILLFIASYFLHSDIRIAFAVSLAMFGTITSSIFTGFVIPYIFIKLKQDPANTSGPIGTVVQDFLSVLIYFLVISNIL